MRNFEEFGFKVGLSSIGYEHPFSTLIQDVGFARLRTYVSDWIWKKDFNPKKRDESLTLKLNSSKLSTYHGQNSFTLAYRTPFPTFPNIYGPHFNIFSLALFVLYETQIHVSNLLRFHES